MFAEAGLPEGSILIFQRPLAQLQGDGIPDVIAVAVVQLHAAGKHDLVFILGQSALISLNAQVFHGLFVQGRELDIVLAGVSGALNRRKALLAF